MSRDHNDGLSFMANSALDLRVGDRPISDSTGLPGRAQRSGSPAHADPADRLDRVTPALIVAMKPIINGFGVEFAREKFVAARRIATSSRMRVFSAFSS